MNHLISSDQFSKTYMENLFSLADQIRLNPREFSNALQDKVIATLFYEPSTRTRLSFESALQRLGAKLISTENAKEMSSAIKGENIRDTIRVIQGYCDAIILRHFENDAAQEATQVARIPIINAGGGTGEHPTQALLDLYTIQRNKGYIDGLQIAILGDLKNGRTIHSLVKTLSHFNNITIYGLSREGLELNKDYIKYLEDKKITYFPVTTFEEIPHWIDILYHTRTQTERMNQSVNSSEIVLDRNTMNYFSDKTLLMHPLPRNKEISQDLDDDHRAIYFQQSENGLYIRMALLLNIMVSK